MLSWEAGPIFISLSRSLYVGDIHSPMGAILEIKVAANRVSELTNKLEEFGAQWVEFLPASHEVSCQEPEAGALLLWPTVRVVAQYESKDCAVAAMRAVKGEYGLARVRPKQFKSRDWIKASRSGFVPCKFGNRLWVVPSWCDAPKSDLPIVYIEPGLAFGTGMHPSTQLCLNWLATNDVRGAQIADFGCGSGILSVAAAVLGAKEVVAYDRDPQAVESAKRNAGFNGVSVKFLLQDVPSAGLADVVLANILARPLIDLASLLTMSVRPGGKLILSGFTVPQSDVVSASYIPGCTVLQRTNKDNWSLLELERRSGVSQRLELH